MKINKVIFIATRQIGDVLITTPLITRAREIWPNATFDFLGYEGKTGIISGNSNIRHFILSPERPQFFDYLKLLKAIFRKYDLAIITQPSDRAHIYGLLAAGQRVAVIPNKHQSNWWKKIINFETVEIDYFNQHVVTEKLQLLRPFIDKSKKKSLNISSEIFVTPPASADLPIDLEAMTKESVVIHPCPLTKYKRWPLQNWIEVIEFLGKRNIPVFISGGPADADRTLANEILENVSAETKSLIIDGTGRLNFAQLSNYLKHAKAFIGVDTSVTHLAAACDIPTITMFGATPPTNFGPWPNGFTGTQPYQLRAASQTVKNVTILQGPEECVPCRKAGCEDRADSKSECLEKLPASQVIDQLKVILGVS
jgi:heptosyltransferase-3